MISINVPIFSAGNSSASRMARPLVPPMAKWFGALNKAMPAAVTISPALSIRNQMSFFLKVFFIPKPDPLGFYSYIIPPCSK